MNGRQLAQALECSYQTAGHLLRSGTIKATRARRCWEIDTDSFRAFQRRNNRAIAALKREYTEAYWHGVTVEHLDARTRTEFDRRGIVHRAAGFAERAIYENIMRP